MRPIDHEDEAPNVHLRTNILRFWLVLYGFVGTQLAWTMRPFFATGKEFSWLRPREEAGSFIVSVWESLRHVLH
jgi:hypothetical protein